MFLIFFLKQAEIIVLPQHFVDHRSATDGGVVVGGCLFHLAADFVGRAQAADSTVDSGAERCDAVVKLPTEIIVFVLVNRAVLVLHRQPLALAVVRVFDAVVDAVRTVGEDR